MGCNAHIVCQQYVHTAPRLWNSKEGNSAQEKGEGKEIGEPETATKVSDTHSSKCQN